MSVSKPQCSVVTVVFPILLCLSTCLPDLMNKQISSDTFTLLPLNEAFESQVYPRPDALLVTRETLDYTLHVCQA